MQPLVSIIIPTYNRTHLIGETLDSIIGQTYANWECIVVDDGSNDETSRTIEDFIKKDSRFQFHLRPSTMPKGANSCRNFGFQVSKGEYVNWLDDDDLFSANKIEEQINLLKKSGSLLATCKWGRFENTCKFTTKELPIYRDYENGYELIRDYGKTKTFFPSHAFMLHRNIVVNAGLWNEDLSINQDGEFFCRVLINTGNIVCAKNCNVQYRIPVKVNTSSIQNSKKAADLILSWQLISDNLLKIDSSIFNTYLKNAKDYVFKSLKNDYHQLLLDRSEFFKEQFKEASFFNRLMKKIF